MAEGEVEQGNAPEVEGAKDEAATGAALTGAGLGRFRGMKRLRQLADEAVGAKAEEIVTYLLKGLEDNRPPGVKMLVELAEGHRGEDESSEEVSRSLAEVLWKELEELGTTDGD